MADQQPPRRLVLASSSPRRRDLLARLGLAPEVVAPDVDEEPRPGEPPDMLVRRLAVGKALAVAGPRPPTDVVLAGDTVVASDGRILGKPVERHAAAAMLLGLSGRVHQAVSAVAVARGGAHPDDVRSEVATTHVTFRELDRADLDWYLASQEWHGKAGAYGLQGSAAVFVTELRGLDTTVIGLPLGPAVSLLRDQGFDPLRPPA